MDFLGDIAPLKVFRAVTVGTTLAKAVGFLSEDDRLLAAVLNEFAADAEDIDSIGDMAREYHERRGATIHPSIHVVEAWLAKQAILSAALNRSGGRTD